MITTIFLHFVMSRLQNNHLIIMGKQAMLTHDNSLIYYEITTRPWLLLAFLGINYRFDTSKSIFEFEKTCKCKIAKNFYILYPILIWHTSKSLQTVTSSLKSLLMLQMLSLLHLFLLCSPVCMYWSGQVVSNSWLICG